MNNTKHQREANTVMLLWIFICILKGTLCFLGFNFNAVNFLASSICTEIFAETAYTIIIASNTTRMLKFKWIIDIHIKKLNQRIMQLRQEGTPCDLCVKLDQTEFLLWKAEISFLWMGLNLSFTQCKSFWMTNSLAKTCLYTIYKWKRGKCIEKVFTLKYSPSWALR